MFMFQEGKHITLFRCFDSPVTLSNELRATG